VKHGEGKVECENLSSYRESSASSAVHSLRCYSRLKCALDVYSGNYILIFRTIICCLTHITNPGQKFSNLKHIKNPVLNDNVIPKTLPIAPTDIPD